MRVGLTALLLFFAYAITPALALGQIDVADIDDAPSSSGGQNCTQTHQSCSLNNGFCWEWNYDAGAGPACANSEFATLGRDNQSRKFDVSWDPSTMMSNNGGAIFHAYLGSTNLDKTDTAFSYDVWVQHTDLTNITALEFDLNQVLANGHTIIFGTQCVFSVNGGSGYWEYTTNTGTTTMPVDTWNISNIPCSKSDWATGQWHHVVISYHRASNCTPSTWTGTPTGCIATYDSVSLNGVTISFTGTHSGPDEFSEGWTPFGTLLVNVQLDWSGTSAGSMSTYVDLFTVNSPRSTHIATPTFSPGAGTYTGPQSVTVSTTTPGATICYTTDGTPPAANGGGQCTHGVTYTSPVAVSKSETLKAIGSKDGIDFDSSVRSANYTIN